MLVCAAVDRKRRAVALGVNPSLYLITGNDTADREWELDRLTCNTWRRRETDDTTCKWLAGGRSRQCRTLAIRREYRSLMFRHAFLQQRTQWSNEGDTFIPFFECQLDAAGKNGTAYVHGFIPVITEPPPGATVVVACLDTVVYESWYGST